MKVSNLPFLYERIDFGLVLIREYGAYATHVVRLRTLEATIALNFLIFNRF